MQLSDEIILVKYGEEIEALRSALLSNVENISTLKLVSILRCVVNNPYIPEEDFESLSKLLEIDSFTFKKIYDDFYQSNREVKVSNFKFPSYMIERGEQEEGEIVKSIIKILDSSEDNRKIFEQYSPTNLISKKFLRNLDDFLSAYVFNGSMKESISRLIEELKERNSYRVARVQAKDGSERWLKPLGDVGKRLTEGEEYYVRVSYPFIRLHDKLTLSEVASVKLDRLNVKYVG